MSIRDATKPQDLGPERLKPDGGTRTLPASVEATVWATDLCTPLASRGVARERILAWLAEGVREVTWAICSVPRERWLQSSPSAPGSWSAARHLGHLELRETHCTLPAVARVLADAGSTDTALSCDELERLEAASEQRSALESAEAALNRLGQTRFELLQRLESAPDGVWEAPLATLLLEAHQHELEHVAAIWKLALTWEHALRAPIPTASPSHSEREHLLMHPADRLEESH
jgi:hypothetical protein